MRYPRPSEILSRERLPHPGTAEPFDRYAPVPGLTSAPMITLKSLSTAIVVVASLLILGWIAVREWRYHTRRRRKKQRPVVQRVQRDETVYSMFRELPEADESEYDPIGEAKIYLAYGNKRMALTVLNTAATKHPERDDIRQKIIEIESAESPG
jgi:hypothetical protein